MLALEEPHQNTESGPDSSRIWSSLSPISWTAWSQEIFFHLPSTSFMGYLRRLSPWPCSRTEAPLAQWAPRLNGDSKSGSWPVQTPFWTSAITPQPTEQWVHTLRRILRSTPNRGAVSLAARARRISDGGSTLATPAPPAVSPERRRKVRRSMVDPPGPSEA